LFRTEIDEATLSELRGSVNKGWALGGKGFLAKLEATVDRPVQPRPRGGKREGAGRPRSQER
jgi:putative transposase